MVRRDFDNALACHGCRDFFRRRAECLELFQTSGWQSLRVGLVRDDLPYRHGPPVLGFLSWWCRKDCCASTFLDEVYVGRYHPNLWAREAVRSNWASLDPVVDPPRCFYRRARSKVTAFQGPNVVLHRTLMERAEVSEAVSIVAICFGWAILGAIAAFSGGAGSGEFSDFSFFNLIFTEMLCAGLALLVLYSRKYAVRTLFAHVLGDIVPFVIGVERQ